MFGLGKKNKAKVEVETAKGGGPIKRLRLLVGVSFIVGIIHAIEAYFGEDLLPEGMEKEVAELVLTVIDVATAYFAWKSVKPAVIKAADAQGVEAVAAVKTQAGVTPAVIEAAEPAVNLGVINAADAQGEKEIAQARDAALKE